MCTLQVCIHPFIQRERWRNHPPNRAGASSNVVDTKVVDR
jgi:hypothetical protein